MEAGLTQAEVAERMEVPLSYVAKLECGQGTIRLSAISRHAAVCGKKVAITLL